LQKTWFIREKKSPVSHFFCLEVLRDKEQGIRLEPSKINRLEEMMREKMERRNGNKTP
jgi:hypothetical protein